MQWTSPAEIFHPIGVHNLDVTRFNKFSLINVALSTVCLLVKSSVIPHDTEVEYCRPCKHIKFKTSTMLVCNSPVKSIYICQWTRSCIIHCRKWQQIIKIQNVEKNDKHLIQGASHGRRRRTAFPRFTVLFWSAPGQVSSLHALCHASLSLHLRTAPNCCIYTQVKLIPLTS